MIYPLCVGVNAGYGYLKGVMNSKRVSLMTLFGKVTGSESFSLGKLPGVLVEEKDGSVWAVGERAAHTTSPMSPKNREKREELIALHAVLGSLLPPGDSEIVLVTGTPVEWYPDRKPVPKRMEFSVNGKEYRVSVVDSSILPEPVGVLRSRMLNEDGRLLGRESWSYLYDGMVLDVGTRSSDVAVLERGVYSPKRSRGIPIGGNEVVEYVQDGIWREYRLELDYRAAVEAVTSKQAIVNGRVQSLRDLVREGVEAVLMPSLISLCSRCAGNGVSLSGLLVSGGYGGAAFPHVKSEYPVAELSETSFWDVAVGFSKQARLLRLALLEGRKSHVGQEGVSGQG